MVMTDPIADMLTRIRNANQRKHRSLEMPSSKIKAAIAEVLKAEGFISEYEITKDEKLNTNNIKINLKYVKNNKVIQGIKRVSKPGLRVYSPAKDLPRVLSGLGVAIISTSQGIMSDKLARNQKLGGEVLAYV